MKIVNACLNMQKVENYCLNFESSECEKQIEISLEFCVLKFPDLFDFCNKDLKKIVLMIMNTSNPGTHLTKNHYQGKENY